MRSSIVAACGLLAMGVSAGSAVANACIAPNCMNDAAANQVANNFGQLISAYTPAAADAYLTTDFTDYSDGVSTLINSGCPNGPATLGAATFTSRDAFKAGQGSQPNITFNLLNVWHNCNTVTLRWRGPMPNPFPGAPDPQTPVVGLIVLETQFNGYANAQPFLIKTVYSEFNSGSWLYDLNVFKPNCTAASKRAVPAAAFEDGHSPLSQ
ncbi:25S rRNA (adenine2142-N1)-methyltransferase [Teratosphaeriaceae sp. CCFEE 6253]|nr:25S rRNA (adenine2142-N1)-methyltransferase [Teratosphaeriaceae sp. CCFEE 6253]